MAKKYLLLALLLPACSPTEPEEPSEPAKPAPVAQDTASVPRDTCLAPVCWPDIRPPELAFRAPEENYVPAMDIWEFDSRGPATPAEREKARENIRTMDDDGLTEFIEALEVEEERLPADMAQDLAWMREERAARRAAGQVQAGT